MYKNISLEEEVAEADAEADENPADVDSDDSGIIYAYSFPAIIKGDGSKFPVKIGLTTTGDAASRIAVQCKTTCCFEYPKLLGTWETSRVRAVEKSIHYTLEARGFKRNAPGTEWFDTTLTDIENVILFIQPTPKRLT